MDSNHEWQRQQTQQRLNSRRQVAEAERQVREAIGEPQRPGIWTRLLASLRIRKAAPGGTVEASPLKRGVQPNQERV